MAILTKTVPSSSFSLWTVLFFIEKSFIFFVKIVFEVDKKRYNLQLSTILMRLFDYPYNNIKVLYIIIIIIIIILTWSYNVRIAQII